MFNFKQQRVALIRIVGLSLLVAISQSVQAQLDDPTRPANASNTASSETKVTSSWDLSSILVSPQRSIAIINGKTVRTGETLSGASVLSINETGVKLRHRGKIILLKLFPADVKTARDVQK